VLADSLAVPCRLVKGRQYTGSDDGALNIVKFNDGRYCAYQSLDGRSYSFSTWILGIMIGLSRFLISAPYVSNGYCIKLIHYHR
jgi:hypothetical protein